MRTSPDRLQELRNLLLLDSASERSFDEITEMLAATLSVPIVLVNLLDEKRDWFKSRVGLTFCESPAETSFCEIFLSIDDDFVVVSDTLKDPRFATHPLVAGEPHVRFYAAARLKSNGYTVGTLCAYDVVAKHMSEDQAAQMKALTTAVIGLIDARKTKPPAAAGATPAV